MDKYKLSAQDWNEDIAPVLRTFCPLSVTKNINMTTSEDN